VAARCCWQVEATLDSGVRVMGVYCANEMVRDVQPPKFVEQLADTLADGAVVVVVGAVADASHRRETIM
jgi:hypothetical protein